MARHVGLYHGVGVDSILNALHKTHPSVPNSHKDFILAHQRYFAGTPVARRTRKRCASSDPRAEGEPNIDFAVQGNLFHPLRYTKWLGLKESMASRERHHVFNRLWRYVQIPESSRATLLEVYSVACDNAHLAENVAFNGYVDPNRKQLHFEGNQSGFKGIGEDKYRHMAELVQRILLADFDSADTGFKGGKSGVVQLSALFRIGYGREHSAAASQYIHTDMSAAQFRDIGGAHIFFMTLGEPSKLVIGASEGVLEHIVIIPPWTILSGDGLAPHAGSTFVKDDTIFYGVHAHNTGKLTAALKKSKKRLATYFNSVTIVYDDDDVDQRVSGTALRARKCREGKR